MTVMAVGCTNVYSPLQDRAVSDAGTALRESLESAIDSPPSERLADMVNAIGAALRHGYETEAVLVDIDAYGRMIEFLSVLPSSVPLPGIVVESATQIGLDWDQGARRTLSVTVTETPYLGYAALLGHEPLYGRVPFAGQVPETVEHLLRRIFPTSSGS